MRPYRIVEEVPDEDDEYPQVVPIGGGARSRPSSFGLMSRPRPWTPRDGASPTVEPKAAPPPLEAKPGGLTGTQKLMIASFIIICVGMVLGMVMVRVWDEASRAVAALPPEGSAVPARTTATQAAKPAVAAESAAASPATAAPGAITTEIRVLQPNYTVAPGDTLGIIARRHGTSVDALASINNLENRNSLGVGQRLIIP